ncbi:Protein MAIN-LIKE 1 [Glycine soja]
MFIMVRTKGLGQALVMMMMIMMPPTAHVVEDPPMAAEELNEEQQQPPVEEGVTNVKDFPRMERYERLELKLSSHGRKMAKFGRLALEIEGLVATSRLIHLIACSLDTDDRGLMPAFHKETSSFHLPDEEVTITLDDMASLLHLPIVGAFHTFELLHVDDIVDMLVELLEVSAAEGRVEMIQCHDSYTKIEACHWIVVARAYLLHLLGCTLFSNKSVTYVHVSGTYAWGTVTLVHMYDNLNETSKSTMRQLARYITLLQALPVSTYRRRLDRLTPDVVYWIPNGDHRSFREFEVISLFSGHLRWGPLTVIHRPKKVVRQFGYIQTIPPHLVVPSASVEEMDAVRLHGVVLPDFTSIYDSGTTRGSSYSSADVHQQPVAAGAPNEVDVNVHRPGHVVDGYVAIVDKLERLLNLRIPTEGIKPYIVVEKCLSIARSYIGQPTVGQRSRHRQKWHMSRQHEFVGYSFTGKNPKIFDILSGCIIDRLKDVVKQVPP